MTRLHICTANPTARLDILTSLSSADSLTIGSVQSTNPSNPTLATLICPVFFFIAWGAGCESCSAKGNWVGLGSCVDKGRQSDRTRGFGADLAYEELPSISLRRSARIKCFPFISSAGSIRGRTYTMYKKGLAPNPCRFFKSQTMHFSISLSFCPYQI